MEVLTPVQRRPHFGVGTLCMGKEGAWAVFFWPVDSEHEVLGHEDGTYVAGLCDLRGPLQPSGSKRRLNNPTGDRTFAQGARAAHFRHPFETPCQDLRHEFLLHQGLPVEVKLLSCPKRIHLFTLCFPLTYYLANVSRPFGQASLQFESWASLAAVQSPLTGGGRGSLKGTMYVRELR